MSMKETDRRWLPAERDALASEAIGGPSLTYWQDCWHRLCRNKTALLSMVVVVIVVLSAIFVPMFWPYSYEEQDLRYANIPPELEIYDLGGNSFVYVTSDYKCIDTDGSGHLLGASTLVKDDKAGGFVLPVGVPPQAARPRTSAEVSKRPVARFQRYFIDSFLLPKRCIVDGPLGQMRRWVTVALMLVLFYSI